jgi:hypothetical protein
LTIRVCASRKRLFPSSIALNGQRALEDHRHMGNVDPLYSDEMEKIVGPPRKQKSKTKKSKKPALPDPQYLMMLKMMDPNIDMVISCYLSDFDYREFYGYKETKVTAFR